MTGRAGAPVTPAALRGLLLDSLQLWNLAADLGWEGAELVLAIPAGRSLAIRAAEPSEYPARWFLHDRCPGGACSTMGRPAASITGLLAALRGALGIAAGGQGLRVSPGSATASLRMAASPASGRVPVLVVTGALGSGKTTLIRRLLADPRYDRTAVVVNEFGEVGLDHALIASSTENLVQLTTGCLCCAVRGDLLDTLLDLDRRRRAGEVAFDRVVIETSGLADPAPILHGLMTDPAVAAAFAVQGVLTLVDAVHGPASLAQLVEARQQVALADRILLTKTDAAAIQPDLRAAIAALNLGVTQREAVRGAVDPGWLFAPGSLPRLPAGAGRSRFSAAEHTSGIGSIVLAPPRPVPAAALALFLQALADHAGNRLLRAKGLLDILEEPHRPALVHGVRHVFEPPVWLEHWPDDARRSFLVLIAQSLPPRWPARLLAAIVAEVQDETARRMADGAAARPSLRMAQEPLQEASMTTDPTRFSETRPAVGRRALGRLAAGVTIGLAAPAVVGRAQPAILRVANIQPITGPSAAYGWRTRDGAQLALDEINAGGLQVGGTTYRLAIALQDMANDPQQAVTLLRQAASNSEILAVIGPANSVGYVPSVPAAGPLQIPMVGAGSGAPIRQWNPWAYRVNPVSDTAIPVLLRKVHEKIAFKRLAVIYDQTQDGQAGDAQVCRAQARALGYEVVAFEAFRAGDQDFSAQLATIRVARPDAVFVAAATGDGVKLATQVRELGIRAPMMTGFGSFQDPVYWDGTQGVVRGSYTWLAQDLASPSPAVKSFMDNYRQRFQQEATSFATYGADAVSAIAGAIAKAGNPSRAKVQEALSTLDITTPIGTHLTFRNPPDGENKTPTVVAIEITGRATYTAL